MAPLSELILKWDGPITPVEPANEDQLAELNQPGVYAWEYPKDLYGKLGLYIGKANSIAMRLFQHLIMTLSGQYMIFQRGDPPCAEFPAIDGRNVTNLARYLGEIADGARFERCLEAARETGFWFACCPKDLTWDAEHLLVKSFDELAKGHPDDFFATQRVRDTRRKGLVSGIVNSGIGPVAASLPARIRID